MDTAPVAPAVTSAPSPPETPPPPQQAELPSMAPELEGIGGKITPLERYPEYLPTGVGVPMAWSIGDAPFSFYTVIYRVFGTGVHWVGVTARGVTPEQAFNAFEQLMKMCADHGWQPPNAQPETSTPPATPAGHAANPPTPGTPPAAVAPPADGSVLDKGTGDLHSITVEVDGKIKFMVGALKYPLTDSRTPTVIAELFDKELNWTPAHFATPTVYDCKPYGLKADWIKKSKGGKTYYDIIRVHK